MRNYLLIPILLAWVAPTLWGQVASDSITLNWSVSSELVLENHPLARQANLRPEQAKMLIRKARGYFDPYVYSDLDMKQFSETNYFRTVKAGLKVPTWYGVTVNGGYQATNGTFLDPMLTVPTDGLVNVGVEVNLGRDLFIDKRRAELKKAKIYAEANYVEQRAMLNELMWRAARAYWNWSGAYARMKIYEDGVKIADERFQNVKSSFLNGDKPAIDTLESYIQRANRLFKLNEATIKYRKAGLEFSNFLWNEEGQPLEISERTFPTTLQNLTPLAPDLPSVQAVDSILANHPEMLLLSYKMDALGIQRRWNKEQLKPRVSLKFDFLSDPTEAFSGETKGLSLNNFKLGANFAFPLFLRKQRADLGMTNLALKETQYKISQKGLEISNKIKALLQESQITRRQILDWRQVLQGYFGMLEGEMIRFDAGESSVFLVNSREIKVIEARLKLVDLVVAYPRIQADLFNATGGGLDQIPFEN